MKLYNTQPIQLSFTVVKIGPLIKARDKRRIAAVEMKCMRKIAAYTWTDYKTSTEIARKINIPNGIFYYHLKHNYT